MMKSGHMVRLTGIEIWNFKNVVHGTIDLTKSSAKGGSDIIGIFGQNGSGKTALLDAVELLRYVLRGQQVPARFADYIHVEEKEARFQFSFHVLAEGTSYEAVYSFTLRKVPRGDETNTGELVTDVSYQAVVCRELLKCSYKNDVKQQRLMPWMDADSTDLPFAPETRYMALVGRTEKKQELLVVKALCETMGRSFLFSPELLGKIRKNCKEPLYLNFLEALVHYGNFELFVINTANTGVISLNGQPFAFHLTGMHAAGQIMVPIDKPETIPHEWFSILENLVQHMNIVLEAMIPGLTISVRNLGQSLLGKTSELGERVELVSCKNGKEIPLRYESEGIKKIISILQLLIEVYNNPSITVAIDELDSGIFEYLLGEVLSIVQERGKGQLIFTSHNLRPLETLPPSCVVFTTTNPSDRYTRITNLKKTNNLRSTYYRNIILGDDTYSLYDETDNYKIAMAFHQAGDAGGGSLKAGEPHEP